MKAGIQQNDAKEKNDYFFRLNVDYTYMRADIPP